MIRPVLSTLPEYLDAAYQEMGPFDDYLRDALDLDDTEIDALRRRLLA